MEVRIHLGNAGISLRLPACDEISISSTRGPRGFPSPARIEVQATSDGAPLARLRASSTREWEGLGVGPLGRGSPLDPPPPTPPHHLRAQARAVGGGERCGTRVDSTSPKNAVSFWSMAAPEAGDVAPAPVKCYGFECYGAEKRPCDRQSLDFARFNVGGFPDDK